MSTTPWEISIAHPIHNSSFRLRKIGNATLSGNHASGLGAITINQMANDPTAQDFIGYNGDNFMIGDLYKVVIGPSTDSVDINKTEEILINSSAGNVITLVANTQYIYDSGDPVTIYGTGMPDGWVADNDFELKSLLKGKWAGRDDLCSFCVNARAGVVSDSYTEMLMPQLLPNMVYRLSLSFRSEAAADSLIFHVYEHNGSTYVLKKVVTLTQGTADWEDYASTFTTGAVQGAPGKIEIGWNYQASPLTTPITAIDCVNLSFMWPNADNGRGSQRLKVPSDVSVIDLSQRPVNTLLSGYQKIVQSPIQLLERKRFGLKCNYILNSGVATDSEKGSYDTLSHLLAWQDAGYLLSLKTGIEELPTIMTGRIKLDSVSMDNSDTAKRSFGFTFEEVPV